MRLNVFPRVTYEAIVEYHIEWHIRFAKRFLEVGEKNRPLKPMTIDDMVIHANPIADDEAK